MQLLPVFPQGRLRERPGPPRTLLPSARTQLLANQLRARHPFGTA
jgi:hypothetical protein